MERDEIIRKAKSITDPTTQFKLVYECLDDLGVKYQKTTCHKCRRDLYAILLEELELIEDASTMSGWDNKDYTWVYIYPRPVRWEGRIINKHTRGAILEEFCAKHPSMCMKQQRINFQ